MNIKLPGRKATIASALIGVLLYLIGEKYFQGIDLWVVLGLIAITCWLYMYINYKQKTILPVEMGYEDEIEEPAPDYELQISNLRAYIVDLEKRIDQVMAGQLQDKPTASQPGITG